MCESLPPVHVEQLQQALRSCQGKISEEDRQWLQGLLESYLTLAELVRDPTMTDDRFLDILSGPGVLQHPRQDDQPAGPQTPR